VHDDDNNNFLFLKVAGDLVKGKPTYVAIGDLHSLPHADEIGLSA
jgi:ubiquinol-cytochrome c reductase core subunit 2